MYHFAEKKGCRNKKVKSIEHFINISICIPFPYFRFSKDINSTEPATIRNQYDLTVIYPISNLENLPQECFQIIKINFCLYGTILISVYSSERVFCNHLKSALVIKVDK